MVCSFLFCVAEFFRVTKGEVEACLVSFECRCIGIEGGIIPDIGICFVGSPPMNGWDPDGWREGGFLLCPIPTIDDI